MRKMRDLKCSGCGEIQLDRYVDVDELSPHTCGGRLEIVHLPGHANAAHSDDIPGGVLINNLLTNRDGSPKRWYSKSAIRKAAAEKGYTWGATRHVPSRGTDKNPHTVKWT